MVKGNRSKERRGRKLKKKTLGTVTRPEARVKRPGKVKQIVEDGR